jgi:hypothetical protein
MGALGYALAFQSGPFLPRLSAAMNYPSGAVAFMRERGIHGNVLNRFEWGQYLIWNLAPESKVFIDSRFDLAYPAQIVTDHLDFYNAYSNPERVLASYPHNLVLISIDTSAYSFMMRRKKWTLIYRDQYSTLFAKVHSDAALICGVPVVGSVQPSEFP